MNNKKGRSNDTIAKGVIFILEKWADRSNKLKTTGINLKIFID